MNDDYLDPINSVGMADMADSSFCLEFAMRAKNGVRNLAAALTETASPDVRLVLREQLADALALHEEISKLMVEKHWLHPYEVGEQFQMDLKSAETTVRIARMKLFPDDTARLGMFATPDQ
ncbi:spore coat protein [Cohnella sp. CFH 77786]|uniref:spore coat protein n=1 Tax=Cohnella sp. CFH 77786 TaxID=2662265 RepID=UPI001C60DE6D|nr:spore coat protein [Cohnella sp. CFH 77786]MBW5446312.1 spore coat protein [Cohnella sp. CFH 77786]